MLAINENTENENFPRVVWEKLGTLEKGFFPQNDKKMFGNLQLIYSTFYLREPVDKYVELKKGQSNVFLGYIVKNS